MSQIVKRVDGAEYNLVLRDVLQSMQQARGLNIKILNGDDSVKENLNEAYENANKAFQKIKELEIGKSNGYDWEERTSIIQENWNKLQQTTWTSSEEILTEYAAVISEHIALMSDVANDSELLLALSPETFQLIYNNSIELPNLTEHLAQMRTLGVSILDSDRISDEQLAKLYENYYPIKNMLANIQKTMPIVFNNEQFKASLEPLYNEAIKSTETYLAAINQIIKHRNFSSTEYYEIATNAINANFDFYSLAFEELFSYLRQQYNDLNFKVITIFIILIVVMLIAISLFTGLYFAIKQTIKLLEEATSEVASGNLGVTVSLQTKDEMKNIETAFNRMTSQLNKLVHEISNSAEHVSSSSEELHASAEEVTAAVEHSSTAANQMAKDADLQAASLQESAQAMNEMAIGIERIAENSTRVSTLTNETANLANDGNATVEKAFKQMELIRETVTQSSGKIEQLNKQSSEIDSIVNMITEISEQTNLLALNAAIEAASAGEHGKGFAVVADEVRKLAEQSRTSAAKIAELIKSIQTDTTQSVQLMNHVTENVEIGMRVTEETANKFENILSSMNTLKPQMEEISSTAIQFSAQTQQVVSAIQQILEIAQKTSESTEEVAASSEEQLAIMEQVSSAASSLSQMAESLQSLVSQFKL